MMLGIDPTPQAVVEGIASQVGTSLQHQHEKHPLIKVGSTDLETAQMLK